MLELRAVDCSRVVKSTAGKINDHLAVFMLFGERLSADGIVKGTLKVHARKRSDKVIAPFLPSIHFAASADMYVQVRQRLTARRPCFRLQKIYVDPLC